MRQWVTIQSCSFQGKGSRGKEWAAWKMVIGKELWCGVCRSRAKPARERATEGVAAMNDFLEPEFNRVAEAEVASRRALRRHHAIRLK